MQYIMFAAVLMGANPCHQQHSGWIDNVYFSNNLTPTISMMDTGALISLINSDHEIIYDDKNQLKFVKIHLKDNVQNELMVVPFLKYENISGINQAIRPMPTVLLPVYIGENLITTKFAVIKEDNFPYQAIIGRDALADSCTIVDSSKEFLLPGRYE